MRYKNQDTKAQRQEMEVWRNKTLFSPPSIKIKILFILILFSPLLFSKKGTIKVKKAAPVDIIGIWNISSNKTRKSNEIFEFKKNGECFFFNH